MGPRVATLLVLAAACAAPAEAPPPVVPAGWRLADEDGVHPTLPEIFLDVPPYGSPPEISSASADARFALVEWKAPGDAHARPRLVDAREPAADGAGRPLGELLPALEPAPPPAEPAAAQPAAEGAQAEEPLEPEEPKLVSAWSHHGARLAVGRGGEVWILDPERDARFLLVRWELEQEEEEQTEPAPAAPAAEAQAEAQQEAVLEPLAQAQSEPPLAGDAPPLAAGEGQAGAVAEPPAAGAAEPPPPPEPAVPEAPPAPPRALGEVQHLSFTPDDGFLRVDDGEELFEVAVPRDAPESALALDQVDWSSLEVEAPAAELEWSDDLAVAAGVDPLPRAEAAPEAQVWRVRERRAVVLEGLPAGAEVEEASLSPDGRFFFAVVVDPEGQPEPTEVPDFLTQRVTHREGRRFLADDRPSPSEPRLWNAETGARLPLAFDPPPAEGAEAPRFQWNALGWSRPPAGPPVLCLERLSEDWRELELWTWSEGELRRVHAERDERWIGGPARQTVLAPGGEALLLGSERTTGTTTPGRSQVFRLDLASGALRQLTAVAGEVTDFAALEDGGVLCEASEDDPGLRELFLIPADAVRSGGTPAARRAYALPIGFTSKPHGAADGSRVLALFETLLSPAEVVSADFAGSHPATRAAPPTYRDLDLILPRRLVVRAPDGADVYAHVYLPPGVTLDGGGPPRAAIVFIHGAGYLQNVSDSMTRYPLNALFHGRLARLGYLVLDVDYRGSSGYGGAFRTDVQGHLGGKDLDDIHLVVDDLIARGLVDPRRVGCYGGSYGGFLTLMALFTAPERWAAGCALRSVTDWRSYHPDYTQPRLGRPSTDPEAYTRSSPIDHVDGLQDPLLVLHGMVDTNVFAQDSVRLIEALIDAGKDFDAMLYPSQGHAFEDGAHWLDEYRRIERFLIAHLGPPLILADGPWVHAAWVDGSYCPFFFHDDGDDDDGAPLGPPVESIDASSGGVLDTGERGGFGGDSDRGGGGRDRGSAHAR